MYRFILSLFYLATQSVSPSCKASSQQFIEHPLDDDKKVEYFVKTPTTIPPKASLIVLLHGHQSLPKPGGKTFLEDGTLEYYTKKGYIAAAISQPGYGASDGPPDFCGSFTQAAATAVISTLKQHYKVNSQNIFIYGVSRGATVAAKVALKDPKLGGVVLEGCFYNLRTVTDTRTLTNIKNEAGEDEESMHLRSPLDYVNDYKMPILMLHGVGDARAPASQAFDFFSKLVKAGVPARLYLFDSSHRIPKEETQVLIDMFLKSPIQKKKQAKL